MMTNFSIPCNDDFSLATAGKGAINRKEQTQTNERAMNTSVGIQAFAVNTSAPTNIELQTAAADAADAAPNC